MKKYIIAFLLLTLALPVTATEYSAFVEKQYSKTICADAKITVKREHIEEYEQFIGEQFIPAIAYGYGDIKAKGFKKRRISYICLLNKDLKPIWSYVIPR